MNFRIGIYYTPVVSAMWLFNKNENINHIAARRTDSGKSQLPGKQLIERCH